MIKKGRYSALVYRALRLSRAERSSAQLDVAVGVRFRCAQSNLRSPTGYWLPPISLVSTSKRLRRCATDGHAVDLQRRLTDADRHALAVLAANADTFVEREVVADHRDTMEYFRP